MLIAIVALALGQVGKFDNRSPAATYATAAKLEDVERCLIGFGSPPQVYRQPDRPNDVMIVWSASGMSAGNAAARVDLHRAGQITEIRTWLDPKIVQGCAPRAN